jgi:mono/diheme cytochrome c family protein
MHAIQTIMYTGQTLAEYANRTSCARCHTNEGFIEFMETGAVQDTVPLPTRISCTSCHSDHDTWDFENDGPDYALRSTEPIKLIVDDSYHIDYANTSNLCVNCHQPRSSGPEDDGSGTFEITSSHWGPHHGPQSTLLEGIQGAQISGSMSYPAPQSATHRSESSCVACHMAKTTDGFDGSHTFWPSDNACIVCHTNGVPTEVAGLAGDLVTLEGLLENVVSQDGTVVGIVHDGHPQEGTFTLLEAQAAWNYLFIMEDRSEGVHNPAYAKALIRNSVEALLY